MPIELEMEGDYYEVVTAFPNDNKNVNGEPPTNGSTLPPTATTNGNTENIRKNSGIETNKEGGVSLYGADVSIDSLNESIPQNEDNGNKKYSARNLTLSNTLSEDEEYLQTVRAFQKAKTDTERRTTYRKLGRVGKVIK